MHHYSSPALQTYHFPARHMLAHTHTHMRKILDSGHKNDLVAAVVVLTPLGIEGTKYV